MVIEDRRVLDIFPALQRVEELDGDDTIRSSVLIDLADAVHDHLEGIDALAVFFVHHGCGVIYRAQRISGCEIT